MFIVVQRLPGAPVLRYGELDEHHLTRHLVALAQRVGVDNITMRALAAEAGTSTSSVYYHVKDKSAMLDLLIDAVIDRITVPTDGDWQQRLVALYTNAWTVLSTVPGIAALLQQRPHTRAAANMDRETRKILYESGLAADDFAAAHAVLYIHLLGSVELQHRTQARPGQARRRDMERVFTYGLRVILAGLLQVSPRLLRSNKENDS